MCLKITKMFMLKLHYHWYLLELEDRMNSIIQVLAKHFIVKITFEQVQITDGNYKWKVACVCSDGEVTKSYNTDIIQALVTAACAFVNLQGLSEEEIWEIKTEIKAAAHQ